MKRTQLKDALRNIAKQKVSYLSIIVIALLGVSIFLGLDFSAAALTRNGSDFFNAQEYRDIELVSTLLFSPEDLDDIRAVEGVAYAEPIWQVGGRASCGGDRVDVNVVSLPERLGRVRLEEGRLPETEEECVVERLLADEMDLRVGSELRIQDASGDTVQYLNGQRFTVTGIVTHPDHAYTMIPDTWYVLVLPAAFDQEALDGCAMKVELAIEKEPGADRYSEGYLAEVAAVQARLETLAETNAPRRDAAVREQSRERIDEGQRELDEARALIAETRSELDEGHALLAQGEQELDEAKAQLDEAKTELENGEAELAESLEQLESAKIQLDDAKAQLDANAALLSSAKRELDEGKAELEDGWSQLEDAKASIRSGLRSAVEDALGEAAGSISWASPSSVDVDSSGATAMVFWITSDYSCDLNRSLAENINDFVYSGAITDEMLLEGYIASTGSADGFDAGSARAALALAAAAAASPYDGDYRELQSACAKWDEGHSKYIAGLQAYQDGLAQYNAGLAAYQDGLRRYEEGLAAYEEGLDRFNEAKDQYEQGLLDVAAGEAELEESRALLESSEGQYSEGLLQLRDGEEELAAAREKLEKMDPCRWLIFEGNGNASYVQLKLTSKNFRSLISTFALLFIVVGALVIFATVSKMVDEQRTQVGTTKALGFFRHEIAVKYMMFGVSSAFLGALLGVLAARFLMEGFALNGYGIYFTFDLSRPAMLFLPAIIVLLAAALLAVAAVLAASTPLLRIPAIELMKPKVPTGVKSSGSGKKHALSLYSRLILLNMRTDIRRVLVTIVSVAGCCALIVIGVTIKTALNGSLDRQYKGIVDYDWRVQYSPEESETAGEEIEALLRDAGAEVLPLSVSNISFRFESTELAELYCCDAESLQHFYHLSDWKTGEPLGSCDDGILIQKRAAECFGLDVGSEFEIALGGTRLATVRVAGIFDHYVGSPMILSPAYYEQVFGEACKPNAFFVRLNGADENALDGQLRAVKGFLSVTRSDSGRAVFEASTSVVDTLVLLFIFMAAVMAGVVLLNLTSIYVLQKKPELVIMRINGFTVKEVYGYMLRETVLTTAIGILLGLGIGSAIAYKICRLLEQPSMQIVREPSLVAWIVAAIITLFFAALVNYFALRPVRNLKLSDVA